MEINPSCGYLSQNRSQGQGSDVQDQGMGSEGARVCIIEAEDEKRGYQGRSDRGDEPFFSIQRVFPLQNKIGNCPPDERREEDELHMFEDAFVDRRDQPCDHLPSAQRKKKMQEGSEKTDEDDSVEGVFPDDGIEIGVCRSNHLQDYLRWFP